MNRLLFLVLTASVTSACNYSPDAPEIGKDVCAHCNMVVSDAKFGGQIVTTTGRKFKFDSIECMAAFSNSHQGSKEFKSMWVIDYVSPGTWLDVTHAVFLHSDRIPSPMGMYLSAFDSRERVAEIETGTDSDLLTWPEVRHLVAERWSHKGM